MCDIHSRQHAPIDVYTCCKRCLSKAKHASSYGDTLTWTCCSTSRQSMSMHMECLCRCVCVSEYACLNMMYAWDKVNACHVCVCDLFRCRYLILLFLCIYTSMHRCAHLCTDDCLYECIGVHANLHCPPKMGILPNNKLYSLLSQ